MARFCGLIGYAETVETVPGVYEDQIIERKYYGNVVRNSRGLREGDKVIPDISVGNSISIVADAYAHEHFFLMKYVIWAGAYWIVSSVEVQRPRLILQLGGLYHGPKPSA